MDVTSYLLGKKASGGGSSSYSDLSDKPKINNVELVGNKTTSDLGIVIPDVSNLQEKITSTNKLDASLVDDSLSTNKFTNASEKAQWNAKADISDIPTKTSDLTNDSDFQTEEEINNLINGNIFILDNSKLNDTSMYQEFAEAIRKCANEQRGMSIIYQVNVNAYLLNAVYEQIQRFATGTSASGQITFSTDVKRVVLHQYRTMTAIRVNYKYDTITSIIETNETRSYQTLGTDNTLLYTPTTDYNPATKKYVDDSIASAITTTLNGSY